jgi:hypothetical protein
MFPKPLNIGGIKVLFYVIYEFDTMRGESVKPYNPPFKARAFPLTECEESEFTSHDVKPGKHRKYAGILTKAQFQNLMSDQDMIMSSTETMGSLTIELGHIPAVAFYCEDVMSCNGYVSKSAYVTPLIEKRDGCDARDWDRVTAAMQRQYGV